MEEILASIRRIISEDEAPAQDTSLPIPEPEAEAASARSEGEVSFPQDAPETRADDARTEIVEDDEDSDLELTQKVETHGDLDFVETSSPEPAAEIGPPPPLTDIEGLVSDHVAQVAASDFGRLSASILMPAEGRTLEDVVRELLRPLLRQWLDDNLPGIVQRAVEAEVERIARSRVR